jgi:PadR family transcriptional regulator PadR
VETFSGKDAFSGQTWLDANASNVYNVGNMADLLGAFEQAVLLAVWRLGSAAYGRAVLKDVQSVLDRQIAAGAIYATLDRLEHKGLLDSRVEEGSAVRASRVRRYYVLTAPGIRSLNESKASLEQMWRGTSWPLGTKA